MANNQELQDQYTELRCALNRCNDEKLKLGVMYEELLKEKECLEKHHEYLLGMVEAFRICISSIGGHKND